VPLCERYLAIELRDFPEMEGYASGVTELASASVNIASANCGRQHQHQIAQIDAMSRYLLPVPKGDFVARHRCRAWTGRGDRSGQCEPAAIRATRRGDRC
jgi:hypothetical protein